MHVYFCTHIRSITCGYAVAWIMSCQREYIWDHEKRYFQLVWPWHWCKGILFVFTYHISPLFLILLKKKIVMDRGLWKWFPLFSCLNSFYLTFLKRSLGEKRNLGCKWIERWWVVQMLLNRTCEWISFLFLLMWAIKPVMQAFDVALHCLAELQEIENEDQESVSEGEKRRRTGLTCSPSGFSGTQHTEMN